MTEQTKSKKRKLDKQKLRKFCKEYMDKLGIVATVPSPHGMYVVYKNGKVEEWLNPYGAELFKRLNEKKG